MTSAKRARAGWLLAGILALPLTAFGQQDVLPPISKGNPAAIVWDGPVITFAKLGFEDWTLPENQDRITPLVSLTRGNTQGLFNIATEGSFSHQLSPAGTEWAYGTTANSPRLRIRIGMRGSRTIRSRLWAGVPCFASCRRTSTSISSLPHGEIHPLAARSLTSARPFQNRAPSRCWALTRYFYPFAAGVERAGAISNVTPRCG